MYTPSLRRLIDELGRMPGVGPKSAQRVAFYILREPEEDARRLAEAILEVKEKTSLCEVCFNIAETGSLCPICADARRLTDALCVVEDPRDVVAMERAAAFHGRYHVLHGALNPLEGVGPENLRISELLGRIDAESIHEVIVCTNPNLEGEATGMYLARLLGPLGVKVTRIASGLPVGGDLEYADELTLGRAFEGRQQISTNS